MHMVAFKAARAPADTTPPTVSITAPDNNATVSDIVQVTANASDNVGVAGVQFLVDGAGHRRGGHGRRPTGSSWDTRDGRQRRPHADAPGPATRPATPPRRRR